MTALDINQLAEAVAARLARLNCPVLTPEEAMVLVGKNSPSGLHRWCERYKVRPCSKGRYSRRALEMALNKEARRGEL